MIPQLHQPGGATNVNATHHQFDQDEQPSEQFYDGNQSIKRNVKSPIRFSTDFFRYAKGVIRLVGAATGNGRSADSCSSSGNNATHANNASTSGKTLFLLLVVQVHFYRNDDREICQVWTISRRRRNRSVAAEKGQRDTINRTEKKKKINKELSSRIREEKKKKLGDGGDSVRCARGAKLCRLDRMWFTSHGGRASRPLGVARRGPSSPLTMGLKRRDGPRDTYNTSPSTTTSPSRESLS